MSVAPMPEIRIRARARQDQKAIWRCTFERWGVVRADLRLRQRDTGIQRLREFPEIGEPCDQTRAGYRKLHVNRHKSFCRRSEAPMEIVRVLRRAMDLGGYL